MSQARSDAETYAGVLEHAPILKAPDGYVPGPDEQEGLIRTGTDGWGGFIAPGPDAAQFIAEAIEPFLRGSRFNEEAVIYRLTEGTPSALGDGGRTLDSDEAGRIVDVCRMLLVGRRKPPRGSVLFAEAQETGNAFNDDMLIEGQEYVATIEEFVEASEMLVDWAARGAVVLIVRSDTERQVVATLLSGNGSHPGVSSRIMP